LQGPVWLPEGPNLLTFLPKAVKFYPVYTMAKEKLEHKGEYQDAYKAICEDAYEALIKAGFEAESEFLWGYHYKYYWGATEWIFRAEVDPAYPGVEAEYDYLSQEVPYFRSQEVKNAVARVSLTGIIDKPLITLHGTLDALLPITKSSDVYAELVKGAGKEHLHYYYTIDKGTHIDSLYDNFPYKLRPILPCYRAAFDRLVEWVEKKNPPPKSQTVPKPEGEHEDVANSCLPLQE
jgi:hypothetical protein